MSRTGEPVDVAVVGAGLAGLAAARAIASAGRTVVVLEARDRVGGRAFSTDLAGGMVELGATWTGPGQDRLKALAGDLGLSFGEPKSSGASVYLRSGRRLVSTPERGRRDYRGVVSVDELTEAVRRLDAMGATVPIEAPWNAPEALEWDAQTTQTWMKAHVSPPVLEAITHVHEGYLGRPSEISLLHTLFYTRANGGFAGLMGLDGPPHDNEIFRTGAQQVAIRLAAALGDRVRLGSAVRRISQDATGVDVEGSSFRVRGRRAIVAIPPVLAGRLEYTPPMPPLRDHLTQRIPIRGKIRVAVAYDTPFWREEGLSGAATTPLLACWDAGDTQRAVLSILVSIDDSRRLWALPEPTRRQAVLAELGRCFGPAAGAPLGYRELYWQAEEYSRGCVSGCPPGVWTAYGRALREAVGRIHWAGSELATVFPGQMEGAVRSGEDAAAEVLNDVRP